jgi:hypothetical protein
MQSSHAATAIDVAFDDPDLIADAGLVPVVALAERIGLPALVTDRVKILDAADSGGANAGANDARCRLARPAEPARSGSRSPRRSIRGSQEAVQ